MLKIMQKQDLHSNCNIVLFDGECILCNRFFRFLIKYDTKKSLKFATLQSLWASNKLQGLSKDLDLNGTVVFLEKDKIFTKSSAALRIIADLGGLWQLSSFFLLVPAFIRDAAYKIIARNRYTWWGRTNCMIPDSSLKDRFIDLIEIS